MFKKTKQYFAEKLSPWANKHPILIVGGAILIGVGFVSYLRNIESWQKYFDIVFKLGVAVDPNTKAVVGAKTWFFVLAATLSAILVIVCALLIQSEVRRRAAIKIKAEGEDKAYQTLQGMMRAAARIRDQSTPSSQTPTKSFDAVNIVYLIRKDFSAYVRREYSVRAVSNPLHFWAVSSQATAHAERAEYFVDIDFKAIAQDGNGEVVYLPTKNDSLGKGVCLYFLPRLDPGAPARKIAISYDWTGLLRQLLAKREEEIGVNLDSAEPIPEFKLEVYLEDGSGGFLDCYISGPSYTDSKLVACKHSEKQWPGFIYTVSNAPAGRTRFGVMLRLKK